MPPAEIGGDIEKQSCLGRGVRGRGEPAARRAVRIGPLNEPDVFVSASEEICEIICGT